MEDKIFMQEIKYTCLKKKKFLEFTRRAPRIHQKNKEKRFLIFIKLKYVI